MPIVSSTHRQLSTMLDCQLAVFPEHERFLVKRFSAADDRELQFLEHIADLVMRVAEPSIEAVCADYRWLAQTVSEEEIHFRRKGRYRLSKFSDAVAEVYSNAPYMRRYMNGLLVTQLWWRNHSDVLRVFRDVFLRGNTTGFSHLEVGPGHGLFLYLAATAPGCAFAEGWDISPASIEATRSALSRMAAPEKITLQLSDLFAPHERRFDSIVCSEVLEHLEDPAAALRALTKLLSPNGRLFINAPANSPAPDHIYLFHNPEELVTMMEDSGLRILDTHFAPATGATLERARKQLLTISCVVIATRETRQ